MKKILVIDDDTDLQELYTHVLTGDGYEVVTSSDGLSGLLQAKNNNPDLILLDIMLAGNMNGFDVLEELKRNKPTMSIPVIVFSNLDTEAKTPLQIGAADFVPKSETSPETLLSKIKLRIG